MHITSDVIFQLLSVVSNQSALLCRALTTLTGAQVDLSTRKDIGIAHVLTDEDFLLILWFFVIEANKAEFLAKDL